MATENEAKGKWCPFTRATDDAEDDPVRWPPSSACIASACMAWRWIPAKRTDVVVQGRFKASANAEWQNWQWDPRKEPGLSESIRARHVAEYEFRDVPPVERQGYCGLAGALA